MPGIHRIRVSQVISHTIFPYLGCLDTFPPSGGYHQWNEIYKCGWPWNRIYRQTRTTSPGYGFALTDPNSEIDVVSKDGIAFKVPRP